MLIYLSSADLDVAHVLRRTVLGTDTQGVSSPGASSTVCRYGCGIQTLRTKGLAWSAGKGVGKISTGMYRMFFLRKDMDVRRHGRRIYATISAYI